MSKGLIETSKGTLEIEFFDDDAPNTVKNFIELAQKGYYNGLKFHRVVDDFVVQGGDPTGTGAGGPGYAVPCELSGKKQIHKNGALSMAHAGRDTGGSQFFIVLNEKNCEHLNRKHTVFGQVTKGFENVQKIRQGDVMKKVEITSVDPETKNRQLKKLPGRK
ncbi:MAG: peptidylprolyl isomerase [Candidatus Thorarchaeota archaeon]